MRVRRWIQLGGMVWAVLLSSVPAIGDEIRLIPMMSLKEEYNDNIYMDAANRLSDWVTTITPGIRFEDNTERLKTSLTANIVERLYIDNADLNATDQNYQGSLSYALTPRFRMGGNAGFIRDSSPDREIQTTGLVLNASRRDRQQYGAYGDYAVSETTSATLSGSYSKDHYENNSDNPNNSNYQDTETAGGSLLVIHDLSKYLTATKGRFSLNYANYRFSTSTVDNYSSMIGFSREINELWNLQADIGVRYTTTDFETSQMVFSPPSSFVPMTSTQRYESWGGVGNITLSYKDDKNSLDFFLNHDIQPASGLNGASERTGTGLSMSRRFAYEFSGRFSGGYYMNKSDPEQYSTQAIDQQTFYISPGIRYDITRDIFLDAIYTYSRVMYQENTGTDTDQNLVMMQLTMQYPLFE